MKQGDFVWYELTTSDPAAAADFYGKVVGWTMQDSGMPGISYTLASIEDRQVAGIMTLPAEQMPPRPVWFGYVAVNDVDAKAEEVKRAGGSVHRLPDDIPGIGRFAVVADPQGAVFMLFRGVGEPMAPLSPMTTGSVGWHELHSSDREAGFAFYSGLFGWTKDEAIDMGPMGTYQLFAAGAGAIGGMMTSAEAVHPFWLYYFVVDDIDAAHARVTDAGGSVLNGPMEVPGGAWVLQANDPQGGMFALVGMRK